MEQKDTPKYTIEELITILKDINFNKTAPESQKPDEGMPEEILAPEEDRAKEEGHILPILPFVFAWQKEPPPSPNYRASYRRPRGPSLRLFGSRKKAFMESKRRCKWWIQHQEGGEIGPFTGEEMNVLYDTGKIDSNAKIKNYSKMYFITLREMIEKGWNTFFNDVPSLEDLDLHDKFVKEMTLEESPDSYQSFPAKTQFYKSPNTTHRYNSPENSLKGYSEPFNKPTTTPGCPPAFYPLGQPSLNAPSGFKPKPYISYYDKGYPEQRFLPPYGRDPYLNSFLSNPALPNAALHNTNPFQPRLGQSYGGKYSPEAIYKSRVGNMNFWPNQIPNGFKESTPRNIPLDLERLRPFMGPQSFSNTPNEKYSGQSSFLRESSIYKSEERGLEDKEEDANGKESVLERKDSAQMEKEDRNGLNIIGSEPKMPRKLLKWVKENMKDVISEDSFDVAFFESLMPVQDASEVVKRVCSLYQGPKTREFADQFVKQKEFYKAPKKNKKITRPKNKNHQVKQISQK